MKLDLFQTYCSIFRKSLELMSYLLPIHLSKQFNGMVKTVLKERIRSKSWIQTENFFFGEKFETLPEPNVMKLFTAAIFKCSQ